MKRHTGAHTQIVKPAGALAIAALLGLAGLSVTPSRVHADSSNTDSTVRIGLTIAPVKLNLSGLNPALVGKGSYIVNAKADCNGCHVSPDLTGGEPYGYVPGHDPYLIPFTPPAQVNPASYLGGGSTFGPLPGQGIGGKGPLLIFSRNLTPGCASAPCTNPLPEGGHTFNEFLMILRTGHDFDQAHPACPALRAVPLDRWSSGGPAEGQGTRLKAQRSGSGFAEMVPLLHTPGRLVWDFRP